MEQDFLKDRLKTMGLTVRVPKAKARQAVHRVIYDELCIGVIRDALRCLFREVIRSLVAHSAQAIILGWTEIGLLIKPEHSTLPLLDTTELQAEAAVNFAVGR